MKFNINDIEWEISETNSLDGALVVNSKRCKGVCDYGLCKIHILTNLREDVKRQTLAHELTHAFLFSTQMELKDKFDEEYLCEFVGTYSYQILRLVDKYFKEK